MPQGLVVQRQLEGQQYQAAGRQYADWQRVDWRLDKLFLAWHKEALAQKGDEAAVAAYHQVVKDAPLFELKKKLLAALDAV